MRVRHHQDPRITEYFLESVSKDELTTIITAMGLLGMLLAGCTAEELLMAATQIDVRMSAAAKTITDALEPTLNELARKHGVR